LHDGTTSLSDAENWLARASRLSVVGTLVAASSAPLLYRRITGHWPALASLFTQPDHTKTALSGARGVHGHSKE
jgi:hypothetical protein